ncbi:DUF2398 family protein [Salinispora pacifica]|uniref:DUF2398 family protein n=1 Tax=Salinispora pacifica TaxID=351187 RepID=UPI0004838E57|nr:DUF2398 family protein [Salinispora pacifica]
MKSHHVAEGVSPTDLPAYQRAARLVLRFPLVTDIYPTTGALELIHRWEDPLARDLRYLFDYRLDVRTSHARLIRQFDRLDAVAQFRHNNRPFDRRRYAYLCLVLAGLRRSYTEVSLSVIARLLVPQANAIDGLGFEPTITPHKNALADVLMFLERLGALRCSDGSASAWLRDHDNGDALYDVDHDICAAVFRPSRSLQELPTAAALLASDVKGERDASRLAGQRARRHVIEYPVTYFDQVDEHTGAALRHPQLAEELGRLTGGLVERRAEGIALIDSTGGFSDETFPRSNAVARAAALLLGTIADALSDPEAPISRWALAADAEEQLGLLTRLDVAMPTTDHTSTAVVDATEVSGTTAARAQGEWPFISDARLTDMMHGLYARFPMKSFTDTWAADPNGLLRNAIRFLIEMNLLAPATNGVLVLPAAGRYRTIIPVVAPANDQLQLHIATQT